MIAPTKAATALTHIRLAEPVLMFDSADSKQQHLNPLAGLSTFGPYSATAWRETGQRVKVAILAPRDPIDPIRGLLNSLRAPAEPRERADYLPRYPGFKEAFR